MSPCDLVTERLALGEPLAEEEAHVATCPACSRLVALPRLVAASAHAAEPNPGFAIRTTAGARTKLAVRRRNRIITNSLAAIAAVVLGVWLVRSPSPVKKDIADTGARTLPTPLSPVHSDEKLVINLTDEQVGRELVRISDFERAMKPTKHWRDAATPLSNYRMVVHQGAVR
jgi:hypothetical protein